MNISLIPKKIAYKCLNDKQISSIREKRKKSREKASVRKTKALSRAEKAKAIADFKENWEELMAQNSIYNKYDKTVTPRNIEVLNNYGAYCIRCDLDYPMGLSPKAIENILTTISANIFGAGIKSAMIYLEDKEVKGGIVSQLSAVKEWHNIPYTIEKLKITPSTLFLGYDIALRPITLDMAKAPHMLVTGASGSGKSIFIQIVLTTLAYHCSEKDLELYFIQASKDDNIKFEVLKHCRGCITASSSKNMEERFDKILKMLTYINNVIDERNALVVSKLGRKAPDLNVAVFNKEFPEFKLPVIQLWIDEGATIYKETSDKELNKKVKLVRELAERISATGRSVGVYIINTLQRASKEEMSREIKINTSNWISFKQMDSASSQLAIGDEKSALGLPPRVFACKDGSNSIITMGKTPYSTWTGSIKLLEQKDRVEEKWNDEKYLSSRYVHWSVEEDDELIDVEGNNKEKVSINDELIKKEIQMLKSEIEEMNSTIYGLNLEIKSKDMTIKKMKEEKQVGSNSVVNDDKHTTIEDLQGTELPPKHITMGQKEIASNMSDSEYKPVPQFDFSKIKNSKTKIKK